MKKTITNLLMNFQYTKEDLNPFTFYIQESFAILLVFKCKSSVLQKKIVKIKGIYPICSDIFWSP